MIGADEDVGFIEIGNNTLLTTNHDMDTDIEVAVEDEEDVGYQVIEKGFEEKEDQGRKKELDEKEKELWLDLVDEVED